MRYITFLEKCGSGIDVNIEIKQYADIALWGGVWGVPCPRNEANYFAQMNPRLVVRRALTQISQAINPGNQTVFHPADDELVKTCILALHHNFGDVNSDEARIAKVNSIPSPFGVIFQLSVNPGGINRKKNRIN